MEVLSDAQAGSRRKPALKVPQKETVDSNRAEPKVWTGLRDDRFPRNRSRETGLTQGHGLPDPTWAAGGSP